MKVARTDFARLLSAVSRVVEARNTIPILATVRLVAEGGKLTATATDLDMSITSSCDADGDFEACIDAKLLTNVVAKLAGEPVDLSIQGSFVVLQCGRPKFKLEYLPVDDFPKYDAGTFDAKFDADLAALFAPLIFAISQEKSRHYLNGIFVHTVDGKLAACATDGHRMSTQTGDKAPNFPPAIVPTKTISLLPAGEVTVEVSASKIRFTAGETVVTSQLVLGEYPDYERVIPSKSDKSVQFDAQSLRAAASRTALISTERGKGVKLSVRNDQIELTVRAAGEAEDGIDASYEGEPVEVGLNSQYLADILTAMPDGAAEMHIKDANSPVLFTSPANQALRIVGMPMWVQ